MFQWCLCNTHCVGSIYHHFIILLQMLEIGAIGAIFLILIGEIYVFFMLWPFPMDFDYHYPFRHHCFDIIPHNSPPCPTIVKVLLSPSYSILKDSGPNMTPPLSPLFLSPQMLFSLLMLPAFTLPAFTQWMNYTSPYCSFLLWSHWCYYASRCLCDFSTQSPWLQASEIHPKPSHLLIVVCDVFTLVSMNMMGWMAFSVHLMDPCNSWIAIGISIGMDTSL